MGCWDVGEVLGSGGRCEKSVGEGVFPANIGQLSEVGKTLEMLARDRQLLRVSANIANTQVCLFSTYQIILLFIHVFLLYSACLPETVFKK